MNIVSLAAGDSAGTTGPQTPIKVLVVDDDTSIADALIDFLSMMEVEAIARNNAEEGIRAVREDPDLTVVVSDVRMPGRDGVAFASDIAAARGDDTAVSVVLITAFTSAAVAAVVDRQQIFAFLQKPFRPQALLEMVRLAHEAALTRRQHCQAAQANGADTHTPPAASGSTIPADIVQAVAAGIPAPVVAARRVCTMADCDGRLGEHGERVRDILARIVEQLISVTSNGTVLTLSATDSGPDIEFRVDITPAMLGNVAATAEHLDLEAGMPLLAGITEDVRQIGARLSFAPFPTAVALGCSLTVGAGAAAGR